MPHDVVIVGGGIGGAVLANLLTRGGKRVLVLEKNVSPSPSARPEILWPATVEFLRTLLPADAEHLWLAPLQGLRFFEGRRQLGRIVRDTFRDARVQPHSTAGHETRRLLLEQAGCEVLRGVEVRGLLKEHERVIGVHGRIVAEEQDRQWHADCTVGDDGVNSLVRKECLIPLATQGVNLDLLSFEFDWPQNFPRDIAHIWINMRRAATGVVVCGAIPQPGGRAAGLVAVRPRSLVDEPGVEQSIQEFASQDPRLARVLGGRAYPGEFVRYQLHWGNCPRYVYPGAVLIGDAAHPVTPAGGQGANLAVADAHCLAGIMLREGDPQWSEYERLRRGAAERSLALSRGVAWVFSLPDTMIYPVMPTAIRIAARLPSLLGVGLRRIATAFR